MGVVKSMNIKEMYNIMVEKYGKEHVQLIDNVIWCNDSGEIHKVWIEKR
jgi:hypothetical protein